MHLGMQNKGRQYHGGNSYLKYSKNDIHMH